MSDAKHTPGEWIVEGEDQFAKVVSMAGWTIAESSHIHVADIDDAESMHVANMRLIAAAPDLLSACEAALPWVAVAMAGRQFPHPQAVENHRRDLAAIQAAIAKAKGGAA